MGYERCLGQCMLADAGTCAVNLKANTWSKLTEGDTGTRSQAAMIYLPATAEYVLVGGARTHDPQPYDVQALKLADPRWRNQYPPGKETAWGPELAHARPAPHVIPRQGSLQPFGPLQTHTGGVTQSASSVPAGAQITLALASAIVFFEQSPQSAV